MPLPNLFYENSIVLSDSVYLDHRMIDNLDISVLLFESTIDFSDHVESPGTHIGATGPLATLLDSNGAN